MCLAQVQCSSPAHLTQHSRHTCHHLTILMLHLGSEGTNIPAAARIEYSQSSEYTCDVLDWITEEKDCDGTLRMGSQVATPCRSRRLQSYQSSPRLGQANTTFQCSGFAKCTGNTITSLLCRSLPLSHLHRGKKSQGNEMQALHCRIKTHNSQCHVRDGT